MEVTLSRKVVGWELGKTLAVRLALAALNKALAERKPRPGLVHHSDRGLQYARAEYIAILEKHHMVPSMSRPANPYDNASCESFMKTLKREEIYANRCEDLGRMRVNIEEFIEQYYNRQRLHSALAYRPPKEFEQQTELLGAVASSASANPSVFQTMTNTRDKLSASSGDEKKTQRTASVPIENCLTVGVQSRFRVQLGSKTQMFCAVFEGLIAIRATESMGLRV